MIEKVLSGVRFNAFGISLVHGRLDRGSGSDAGCSCHIRFKAPSQCGKVVSDNDEKNTNENLKGIHASSQLSYRK